MASIRDAFLKSGTSVETLTHKFKRARAEPQGPPGPPAPAPAPPAKPSPARPPAAMTPEKPSAAKPPAPPAPAAKPPAPPAPSAAPPPLDDRWLFGPALPTIARPKALHIDDPDRDDAFCAIDFWFRKPNLEASKRPLLVCGPPGSGKSHLLLQYSQDLGIFDEDSMEDFIAMHGLKPRSPGLIDNIESLDRTERDILRKAFGSKHRRLVFTCDDMFQEPAKSFAKYCTVVKLDRPKRPFALKVLQSLGPDVSKDICLQIIDKCSSPETINLTVIINAFYWLRKRSTSDTIDVHADMPMDVPKATATLLYGKPVQCLGGSSDTAFLSLMLQLNVAQTECTIQKLSRTLDHMSLLEIAEERHIMDSETHWNYLRLIVSQAPKLNSKSKFWLTWPKSSKPTDQQSPQTIHEAMKRYY